MGFDVPIDNIISDCNLEAVKFLLEARPDEIGIADKVRASIISVHEILNSMRVQSN